MHQFMMDPQWPYHQSVLQNMESMRRVGVGAWLDAQAVRWRCIHCGTPHSWWDEGCPRCSQAVASYKADL
jgi:rubrerythrin